jgi:hypothetical protein
MNRIAKALSAISLLVALAACGDATKISPANDPARVAGLGTLADHAKRTLEQRAAQMNRSLAVAEINRDRKWQQYMLGTTVVEGSNQHTFYITRSTTGMVTASFMFDPSGPGTAQMFTFLRFVDADGFLFASKKQRKHMRKPHAITPTVVRGNAKDAAATQLAAFASIFGSIFRGAGTAVVASELKGNSGPSTQVINIDETLTSTNVGVNLGCAAGTC